MKPLLLLTGGTGTVGQLLLSDLRRDFRLRITAPTPPARTPTFSSESDGIVVGDLLDATFAQRCALKVDAVIHLAANASPSASVTDAEANVDMANTLFQALAEQGVKRMVVASSVHATGLDYRDGHFGINPLDESRPCCPYGASKVVIESLARHYQATTGGAVSCLRLGLTGWALNEQQYAHTWLATEDLIRLVRAALSREPGFGVYNAVSADSATRWDTSNARADLGWSPEEHWQVDVDKLPLASSCPCQLFEAPVTRAFDTGTVAHQSDHT